MSRMTADAAQGGTAPRTARRAPRTTRPAWAPARSTSSPTCPRSPTARACSPTSAASSPTPGPRSTRRARPSLSLDPALAARFAAPLPEPAGDAEAALADAAHVLDASVSPSRPLFLAYIGSTGLEIGVLASALAATYDANLATSAGGADLRRGAGAALGRRVRRVPARGGRVHQRRDDVEPDRAAGRARARAAGRARTTASAPAAPPSTAPTRRTTPSCAPSRRAAWAARRCAGSRSTGSGGCAPTRSSGRSRATSPAASSPSPSWPPRGRR